MEGLTLTFSASGDPPKQTCTQCRHRKVRCHGSRGEGTSCDNCERLRFACSFLRSQPDQPPAAGLRQTGDLGKPELRRASKACVRCRQHKIRCSGGAPCSSCRRRDASCEYHSARQKKTAQASQSESSRQDEEYGSPGVDSDHLGASTSDVRSSDHGQSFITTTLDNSNPELPHHPSVPSASTGLLTLVDFFFDHVYPMPSYAFLHPQTTRRRCYEGRLEPCLAYAISAAASVRSPPAQRRPDLEKAWAEAAEALIWQHLESPSLARLQATLLVVLYRAEMGQLRRAFMLSALAGRAAAAMRLNHERPGSGGVALEVRRRLMWSLKFAERYFSVGLPEFELCPVENIYIQLPCAEYEFSRDVNAMASSDDQCAYHICVKLEMLRRDIMKLTRSLALCDEPFPQLPGLIRDFESHLDRIAAQLPGGPDLPPAQWARLIGSKWLPRHLLMRLSFHQCQCDLHRLLLRQFRDSAPRVVINELDDQLLDAAEVAVIRHAKEIVQILATLNHESQDSRLLEFDSAICAYSASRLLLFTSRFGHTSDRPSEDFALSRAELSLAAVRRFFPRSTLAKPIVGELRRLIDEFTSNDTPAPSRLASPRAPTPPSHRDPTTQLSTAAKTRQRLAIHSLLRQAGFSDEEDDQDDGPADPSPQSPSALVSPGMMSSISYTQPAQAPTPLPLHAFPDDGPQGETTPETQADSEPWQHQFSAGSDLLHGLDSDTLGVAGTTLNHRSFSFAWLQREQTDIDPDAPI